MFNPEEKAIFYPIYHLNGELGSERSDKVRYWFDRFLIPLGRGTMDEKKANIYAVATGDGGFTRIIRAKYESGLPFLELIAE